MVYYLPILFSLYFPPHTFREPAFEQQVIDTTVAIGYGLAIGDVDGDRKPDILLADKKQFAWYRNGDWKRFVMAENLTGSDNVCIAARDLDGDGKAEVAVGAQWNPGETSDSARSGSVHFLIRPGDPTQRWTPIKLYHEPTVHRMRWVKTAGNNYQLIVLPLHGRGNQGGAGAGVNMIAYEVPKDPRQKWKYRIIDLSMHLTHNFDVIANGNSESLYVGGKEGIKIFSFKDGKWHASPAGEWMVQGRSFGEVRVGAMKGDQKIIAGIEPMHGNLLTVYTHRDTLTRTVLASDLNQGHALATSDLLGTGNDQVIAGWREPNQEKKTGIKIFIPLSDGRWQDRWIDDNGIACEDLQVADLDGDGRKDIIAAGRATHNLKIYWNRE